MYIARLHWALEWYRGSDWLSLALGGFFMLIGLVLTIPVGRYFFRRKGPLAALSYVVAYWSLVIVGGLAASGWSFSLHSSLIAGGCSGLAVGYISYLWAFRSDLRISPQVLQQAEKTIAQTQVCSGCGLNFDIHLESCPVCGQRISESTPAADQSEDNC
jgi:hypothetical protein